MLFYHPFYESWQGLWRKLKTQVFTKERGTVPVGRQDVEMSYRKHTLEVAENEREQTLKIEETDEKFLYSLILY